MWIHPLNNSSFHMSTFLVINQRGWQRHTPWCLVLSSHYCRQLHSSFTGFVQTPDTWLSRSCSSVYTSARVGISNCKLISMEFQFFTINTKLSILLMLVSNIFTRTQKLPPVGWSLNQESNAYPTELAWHVPFQINFADVSFITTFNGLLV